MRAWTKLGLLGLAWSQYNLYYDTRSFNLGFAIGANYSHVKMEYANLLYAPPSRTSPSEVVAKGVPGLNLGLILNKRLHEYFDARSIVSVSLQQRNIYFLVGDSLHKRRLESSYLYAPLLLRYRSQFYRGYRVYVTGGIQAGLNLMSDKRVRDNPELIRTERFDTQWIAGVGMEFYLEKVKFSPEITYTLGMRDIYDPAGTRYGYVIQSLHMQTITLNLQFE